MSERRVQQGRERQPERLAAARVLLVQVLVVTGAALSYFAVRGITEGSEEVAVRNAETLMRIESRLGLAVESAAQALILDLRVLVTAANWVYIWGHWPVIIAVLVWLYARHRAHYRVLLRAMLISGGVGLIIFAAYPVAPPRLMPDSGFVDTVSELSRSYRVLQPPALVNKFAALPSLHVGWNLVVGIVVFRVVRNRVMRGVALLLPALMTAAVVLTGNHYVIDALVGAVVAGAALVASFRMSGPGGGAPALDQPQIVHDHAGDAQILEARDVVRRVDAPHQEPIGATKQTPGHDRIDEIAADGMPVDPRPRRQPDQGQQLQTVARGADPIDAGAAGEGGEQPGALARHREPWAIADDLQHGT